MSPQLSSGPLAGKNYCYSNSKKSEMKFVLKRLTSYDRNSIKEEIIRVSQLREWQFLKKREFDKVSRVSSSAVLKEYGSWQTALEDAGLSHLYSGKAVTQRMREKPGLQLSNEEIIKELRRVATLSHPRPLTVTFFKQNSSLNPGTISTRFRSWLGALSAAGLQPSNLGKRYTDSECLENLVSVWTHYGRPPFAREMNVPPSNVGSKAYVKRWGSWIKALDQFVKIVESNQAFQADESTTQNVSEKTKSIPISEKREIPLGLRWRIFVRDKFKCTICGSSPATDPSIKLHVDHIVAFSKGGKTIESNLRILCSGCNLGKGGQ